MSEYFLLYNLPPDLTVIEEDLLLVQSWKVLSDFRYIE